MNFDDEVRALLILCSFLESWNSLVMAVSNYVPSSNTLKFDDVVGVILSEEMQRKITGETSGNALTMERRGRQKERGRSPENQSVASFHTPGGGRSRNIHSTWCVLGDKSLVKAVTLFLTPPFRLNS